MNQITNQSKDGAVSGKRLIAVCTAATVFLVLSLFLKQVVILEFLFLLAVLLFTQNQFSVTVLFYLLPFATLLRYGQGSMSLFTPLCMVEALLILLRRRRIDAFFAVAFIALSGYVLLACRGEYAVAVKFAAAVLSFALLQYDRTEQSDKLYGFAFTAGLLSSSVLALWREKIPRLASLYEEINYAYLSNGVYSRFSGTFQDPNYYALAVVMAIVFLECEKQKTERKTARWLLVIQCVLLLFGGMTYSKSFFIMAIVMCLYLSLRYRSGKGLRVLLVLVCAAVVAYIVDPFGIVSGMVERLLTGDLTTGRTQIWKMYYESLVNSVTSLLFGNGIGSRLRVAAHNTWLQSLYEIGITGTVLFLTAIIRIFHIHRRSDIRRNAVNYSGLLTVVAMYSFLDGLTGYELPFYLTIANIIYNKALREDEGGCTDVV